MRAARRDVRPRLTSTPALPDLRDYMAKSNAVHLECPLPTDVGTRHSVAREPEQPAGHPRSCGQAWSVERAKADDD